MGKIGDPFKKIRDTKGTFHTKMGSIKNKNGMDLTEAEDIKKRRQKYIEELYKKDLHDPDNHSGVITHLEPDILECEVKWALGSITTNKASGGDGIPVELFQILKDDAMKVLHSICQHIGNTQQWPQDWKRSVFIPIPKKGSAKECSNRFVKVTWQNGHLFPKPHSRFNRSWGQPHMGLPPAFLMWMKKRAEGRSMLLTWKRQKSENEKEPRQTGDHTERRRTNSTKHFVTPPGVIRGYVAYTKQ